MIDGVVLLTHDENVNALRSLVGEDVLVFGIRYSKGLEFPHVIIVDFFSSLDKSLEKAMKSVFSIRSTQESGVEDLKDTAPEVETQLKLLYTAITRCSKRLFFAETKRSGAGEAFRKWCTIERNDKRIALAVEQSVDDVERLKKTADEWVASGVQMGSEAEVSNDLEQSQFWLKQAVFDFRKGNNAELEKRAVAHLSAIELQAKISKNAGLSRELEMDAAGVILQLMRVSMVVEAQKTMIDYISPFVSDYTKERLGKYVLKSLVPPAEED
jgi:ATP-dependent exoDNAse (exonuclease V) beta subunit